MKSKLKNLTKLLLAACLTLGPWFSYGITSILFFGEYEYPTNPDEK